MPVLRQAGFGDALPKPGTPEENLEFLRSDEGGTLRQALVRHLDSFVGGIDLPMVAREFAKVTAVSNPMPGLSRFKRKNGSVNRDALLKASQEALKQLHPQIEAGKRGERPPVRPQNVADQAYPIYCQNHPKTPLPRCDSFRDRFREDPEISRLLEEAGVVKEPRVPTDQREMEQCLMRALTRMHADIIGAKKAGGRQIRLQHIADCAYEIYTKRLPSEKKPQLAYFRLKISRLAKKPEFAERLKKSGIKIRGSS